MRIHVTAIHEHGVLRPLAPVPLAAGQRVWITIDEDSNGDTVPLQQLDTDIVVEVLAGTLTGTVRQGLETMLRMSVSDSDSIFIRVRPSSE